MRSFGFTSCDAIVYTAPMAHSAGQLSDRFQGELGQARLIQEIAESQSLSLARADIAESFVRAGELIQVAPGHVLIEQGGVDLDIFLIVSGRFSVYVNDRKVATRETGTHVGEMVVIDTTAKRSARVVAEEDSVILRIEESKFSEIANKTPTIWRKIAVELAKRLRYRSRFHAPPNALPHIFVGCFTEALDPARAFQNAFTHDKVVCDIWTDDVFRPSRDSLDSLLRKLDTTDFAVLFITPDDIVEARGEQLEAPRDNVVFELGLFFGKLGRDRVFIVSERGKKLKIPTDILGVTSITAPFDNKALPSSIAPVTNQIRNIVRELGPI